MRWSFRTKVVKGIRFAFQCQKLLLFSIFFGAMITFFPMGAYRGTAKQPLSPLTSPLLFTLLLTQHQIVIDSHSNSMASVFSTRQCLWGLRWRLMLWCLPSDYVDWQTRTTVTPGRELAIDTLQGVRWNRTPIDSCRVCAEM